MVTVERLTKPATPAFFEVEVATHCRAEGPLELEAAQLADAAAAELEARFNVALITQTIRETRPEWPAGGEWWLSIVPVMAGAAVTVTVDGEPFEDFRLLPGTRPRLALTGDHAPEGELVATYEAGFGETTEDVPADLRLAIADQAAVLMDNRGAPDHRALTFSPAMARAAARLRRVAL